MTIGVSVVYIRAGYPAFCEGLAGKLLQLTWQVLQINYHGLDLASSHGCTQVNFVLWNYKGSLPSLYMDLL